MMTKAFAKNGAAKVYIVGRRKEKLDEAAQISSNIVPIVGDVTSKESLLAIAEQVKKETGFVNLLICNSGIMPPVTKVKPKEASIQEYARAALEHNFEDHTNAYAVNTVSILFTTYAFLELLDAGNKKGNAPGRKSQILVTSSIAGHLRNPGSNLTYGGTKAAATQTVKHLAGTLAEYEIRVNALAPGLFPSDLSDALISQFVDKGTDPTTEGVLPKTHTPAQRTGSEDDMAGTVLYLASRAAAYLNGNITVIDGGRTSQLPASY